jgi:hypothetical protein
MVLLNEADDRIEEQYFYFPELGVRVIEQPDGVINFTGLHIHTASAPVYKEGVIPGDNIYTRGVLVNYPTSHFLLPMASYSLAADPAHNVIRINSEAQSWEYVSLFLCHKFESDMLYKCKEDVY